MGEGGKTKEREKLKRDERVRGRGILPVACSFKALNSASRRCVLALALAVLDFFTNLFCLEFILS